MAKRAGFDLGSATVNKSADKKIKASNEADGGKVRLNVEMPKQLRAEFKARVALDGSNMHKVVNQLVIQYLNE